MNEKMKNRIYKSLFLIVSAVLLGMYGMLVWKQCWDGREAYLSDLPTHLMFAKTQRGYSLCDLILSKVYLWSGNNSTVMVIFCTLLLVGCQALTMFLVYYIYKKMYQIKSGLLLYLLSFSSIIVVAFFAHYGGEYGISGPYANVWHSPTMFLTRPFMLGIIYCTLQVFKNAKEQKPIAKWLVLNAVVTALCMWAKPSFLASFLPALCVYLFIELIRTKGKSFLFSLKLGLSYAVVLPVLLFQMDSLYVKAKGNETSQMYFKTDLTIGELMENAQELLFAALFVIVGIILLLVYRKTSKKLLGFCGLYYLFSEFFALFVKETGERSAHGNFLWSKFLFLFVMMAFVAGEVFLKPAQKDIPKRWKALAGIIYAGHLITGLLYFWQVFNGRTVLYFLNLG